MYKFLKKNLADLAIVFSVLILLGFFFYWYFRLANSITGVRFVDTYLKFAWLPNYVIPEKYLVDSGGWIPFPTLFGFATLFLSPILIAFGVSFVIVLFVKILARENYKKKYLILGILLFLSLIWLGGLIRYKNCVSDMFSGKDLELGSSKYLWGTGLIRVIWTQTPDNLRKFYMQNGIIDKAFGTPGQLFLYKVIPGQEFQTVCRLRFYPQISISSPLSIDSLTSGSPIMNKTWPYVDKSFCDTRQIDEQFCFSHIIPIK